MQEELRKKILTANIDLHRLEARYYDIIHCENLNSHEQRRLRASLRACIASLDRSARCLDVGAGTGNITSKLVEMGFENITCVDISAEMLEVLRRNVASPTLRIVCSDIDSFLEGDDDTYRLVTMGGVVHHLPDPQRSLRRIFERIDREGVLFITQEPTKGHNRRGAFARVLAEGVKKVEYGCYVARYLIYIVLGKLKYLARDCTFSDYHIDQRALCPEMVQAWVPGHDFTTHYYSKGRFAVSAALLNLLGEVGDYEMIVRKKA